MEDLDLDELDQAVNKMMEKPQKKRAATNAPNVTATTSQSASVPEPVAVASVPATSAPAADESAPARPAELARAPLVRPMPKVPERRRMHPGAMDIIQPSASKAAPPSGRAGRTAPGVTPIKEITPEPVRPIAPAPAHMPAPAPAPVTPPKETPQEVTDEVLASLSMTDESKHPANTPSAVAAPQLEPAAEVQQVAKTGDEKWPDPLDFHEMGAHEAQQPVQEPPKETPPSLEPEPVSVTDSHPDAGSSPFVTTKVEKRPLGAYANTAPAPAPMPGLAALPVPHETTSKGEMAEGSLESKHHITTDEQNAGDMPAMAIPPQYHTAEQHPSDGVRPVFDTKEYHAPPAHMNTAHKGSPVFVVVVVVLIVLTVAVAAIGYFMMTGTFDITKLW